MPQPSQPQIVTRLSGSPIQRRQSLSGGSEAPMSMTTPSAAWPSQSTRNAFHHSHGSCTRARVAASTCNSGAQEDAVVEERTPPRTYLQQQLVLLRRALHG